MEHTWVALHIACHVQFTVMSIGHASHAVHYNSFQPKEDQRTVEMNSKQRAI